MVGGGRGGVRDHPVISRRDSARCSSSCFFFSRRVGKDDDDDDNDAEADDDEDEERDQVTAAGTREQRRRNPHLHSSEFQRELRARGTAAASKSRK